MSDDAALYGDSFADVYDQWYGLMFDTEGAVGTIIELADGRAVCELGVGTGRLAIPLAGSGLRVVGIDSSRSMLDILQAKAPPPSLHCLLGDMSSVADVLSAVQVPAGFGVVLCAFNTFLNLTTAGAQRRCMEQVASVLGQDGRFVVENFVPAEAHEMHGARDVHSSVRSDVPVVTNTIVDTDEQLILGEHVEMRRGGPLRRPWKVRYVTVAELDGFAADAGLRLDQRWSDWHRSPFGEHSGVHVSVYAKR